MSTKMPAGTRKDAVVKGAYAGAAAGAALVAVMYLFAPLVGFKPIPQLLQEPILASMPGFVFGFLIDRLQHLGKVLEEISLIGLMIILLGAAGAAMELARRRWGSPHLSLIAAGCLWLVVAFVVLPVGGEGLLGFSDGPAVPIIWAVLAIAYAMTTTWLLTRGESRREDGAVEPGRRRFLGLLPAALGGGSLLVLALRLGPDWIRTAVRPPEAVSGLSSALTPADRFYVISKNFQDPVVSQSSWSLQVRGLVAQPFQLSLDDLRALPSTTEIVTLECISNLVGGPLMSTGEFVGVPLRDLVTRAQPREKATVVTFHARDDYTESLPLVMVQGAPEILVAHSLDGAPLPDQHGFPARLLVPGHYGMKGPKWLDTIEITSGSGGGYWEQQGWDPNVLVRTTARFDEPAAGALLRLGPVDLGGVAFAGTRGISLVEYSPDGGRTWLPAQLEPAQSPLSWVLWRATWNPPRAGQYQLAVRARDGAGARQTSAVAPSYPSGATGYHTISVSVIH